MLCGNALLEIMLYGKSCSKRNDERRREFKEDKIGLLLIIIVFNKQYNLEYNSISDMEPAREQHGLELIVRFQA